MDRHLRASKINGKRGSWNIANKPTIRRRGIGIRVKLGFTLIEALAAVTLLGVGITASMNSLSALAKAESRARDSEAMQRLALDKLAELVATGQATTPQNGDFQDRNEARFSWNSDVIPSGIQDMNVVTVTVQSQSNPDQKQALDQLIWAPPANTGATQ